MTTVFPETFDLIESETLPPELDLDALEKRLDAVRGRLREIQTYAGTQIQHTIVGTLATLVDTIDHRAGRTAFGRLHAIVILDAIEQGVERVDARL